LIKIGEMIISFFGLGLPEVGILVLAILFLFGGPKIKEIVKTFGQGYKEVNKIKNDFKKEVGENLKDIIK
jgi:Sec-independent protein translocase protein TatA